MMSRFSSTTIPLIGTGLICLWLIGVVSFQRQHLNPLTHAMLESESSAELHIEVERKVVKQYPIFETETLTPWILMTKDEKLALDVNPFFSEALHLKLNPPPPPPQKSLKKKEEKEPKPKPAPPPPPRKLKLFFHGVMSSSSNEVEAWITADDARLIKVGIGDEIEDAPYLIGAISRKVLDLKPTNDSFVPISIEFNHSVILEIPVEQ